MQSGSIMAVVALSLVFGLAACGEKTDGIPDTDTTGSAQSPSETSTATATTTGSTGGTVSNMTPEDKEFVIMAGAGGLAEVQMGTLALQKASNPDVKAFAQMMVTEHSKVNEELSQMATAKGLALPTELDAAHKGGMDHLSALSGAEFDAAYMRHMVEDHQTAVADFEKASASATDTDVKGWAAATLPALRQHLKLAQETVAKLR